MNINRISSCAPHLHALTHAMQKRIHRPNQSHIKILATPSRVDTKLMPSFIYNLPTYQEKVKDSFTAVSFETHHAARALCCPATWFALTKLGAMSHDTTMTRHNDFTTNAMELRHHICFSPQIEPVVLHNDCRLIQQHATNTTRCAVKSRTCLCHVNKPLPPQRTHAFHINYRKLTNRFESNSATIPKPLPSEPTRICNYNNLTDRAKAVQHSLTLPPASSIWSTSLSELTHVVVSFMPKPESISFSWRKKNVKKNPRQSTWEWDRIGNFNTRFSLMVCERPYAGGI